MGRESILNEIDAAAAVYQTEVVDRYQALREAEEYSRAKIAEIRERIGAAPPPDSCGVHGLATAGSLARLEASSQSDLDLIVTTHPVDESHAAPNVEAIKVWRDALCVELNIDPPNPKGVFANPMCRSLVEGISGGADEPYADVAKRILFILESQWLLDEQGHAQLIDKVIDVYAESIRVDPRKNFVFLLNDVVRFFRQLCVNYQYTTHETADGKWPIRNIKLRHSRVLMYFSMIAAIGALSHEHGGDKISALKSLVRMHPLKRLFVVYKVSDDAGFYKIAGFYNTFLHLLSKKEIRDELRNLEYEGRYDSPAFAQLKANSDALSAELLRFYEARRGRWDDRFFEYMIL